MKKQPTQQSQADHQRDDHYTTSIESLSTAAQRARILQHLQTGHTLTTLYARHHLNVMHPAARVMELRKQGYNIVTYRRKDADTAGREHIVAEYFLHLGEV